MSGYPGKPSALAFDDTGLLLATGGGEAATVWSFKGNGRGHPAWCSEYHSETITSLAFCAGQPRLASSARDGSVVVWALKTDGEGKTIGTA